ncbi:unnamed protein product, partial [Effrenium voratum]
MEGLALLEEQFRHPGHEESRCPARTIPWDQSLAELTHATRSGIPAEVKAAWAKAKLRADCGILGQRHAWAALDHTLYLWDYHEPSGVHTVPSDSAIISVALCPAKSSLAQLSYLLVIATRLSVSLLGLRLSASLQVVPLPGFRASAEGALFHCITCTPSGRVLLLSGAPHVYELLFGDQSGWLRSKCRLIRHSLGG